MFERIRKPNKPSLTERIINKIADKLENRILGMTTRRVEDDDDDVGFISADMDEPGWQREASVESAIENLHEKLTRRIY